MYKTKFSVKRAYTSKFKVGGATVGINVFNQDEKRWCKTHVTGFWGKDGLDNWYKICVQGHKLDEKCEVVKNE